MASSASLKDLSKAIVTFFTQPTPPASDDLSSVIDAYLRKHQKYDDAASERLQEELLSIFDKHVKDTPCTFAQWLTILRRMIPILRTPNRIFAWWDSSSAIISKAPPEKGVVTESLGTIMAIITVAEEESSASDGDLSSHPLVDRLFTGWMEKLYPAASEGATNLENNERITRQGLIEFGKRHPKTFFTTLDRYFVKKQYRKTVLRLLGDYLQSQPPHIYQILHTPLFSSILGCLQLDTSTTIVSAALTTFIMLLPHMPSSLAPHLPTLFNIYTRLLFWSRKRAGAVEPQADDAEQATATWDTCSYQPEIDCQPISHLLNYYTMLYGLYPINFMDYIRKPQRYLRHANVANADDMEVQPTEIRDQSEKFRRRHVLHPNFYTLTIDSEKTDFGRWVKSEASELVAECMGLCLVNESTQAVGQNSPMTLASGAAPASDASIRDGALLHNSGTLDAHDGYRLPHSPSTDSLASSRRSSAMLRRGSHSSSLPPSIQRDSIDAKIKESSSDSPTLSAQLVQSLSQSLPQPQLQDMIQSNKAIKSGLHQSLTNDSVPSLSLSQQESVAERPAPSSTSAALASTSPLSLTEPVPQLAQLQRQILLLQNDLNFERYLKQQHMAHIGDLRRRQLEEAVTEAEAQNFLIANRNLKNRFEEAKKAEMQVRRDSEKSRALAKKWEADLSNKLKKLRDESKRLKTEYEALQKELDGSKAERDRLRVLMCDAEVKELNSKQNMQSIEIHSTEIHRLKSEVGRLMVAERDYQTQEQGRQRTKDAAVAAEEKAEVLAIKLASRENEMERCKKLFQSQIATLQARLAEAQEGKGQPSRQAKESVEAVLAASREKQAELQKQCNLLMRKYTALQSSLLDMKTGVTPGQLQMETSAAASEGGDTEYMSMSASPVTMKMPTKRALSSLDVADGTAFDVTPPLGSKGGQSISPMSGGWVHQPVSSLGTDESATGSLSMSPDQRPLGRSDSRRLMARSHSDLFSGAQSRLRRDSKDKGKDEEGKKEKKTSGLRGIRGFMYD